MKKQTIAMIFISVVLFLIGLMGVIYHEGGKTTKNQEAYRNILISGEYSIDNGQHWKEYSDYHDIEKAQDSLLIRGHVTQDIPEGNEIGLYLYRLHVSIWVNGKSCFESDSRKHVYWESAISPGISTEDEVTIIMQQITDKSYSGSYRILLSHLGYGTRLSLIQKQIADNLWKIVISILILLAGIASLLILVGLTFLKLQGKRGYLFCGLLLVVGSLCTLIDYEYITLLFQNDYLINSMDTITQGLIVALLVSYLINYIKTERYIIVTRMMLAMWFITLSVCCLYIVLQKTENIMGVLIGEAILILITSVIFLIMDYRNDRELRTKNVLLSSIILVLATLLELIHYLITNVFWIYVFQIGILFFTVVQYWVMVSYTRQNIRDAQKVKEMECQIIKSEIEVMMSQIQPHFLYNAISDMSELCLIDAGKASEALTKFGRFLRANMESLSTTELIPIHQELEHVKNYVYLQQMRFGERVLVKYDIQTEQFCIPALTLQPLIENAIHHGICCKEEGGMILIQTYEDAFSFYVAVTDDGAGFQTKEMEEDFLNYLQKKRLPSSHVGITNIRIRIREKCDGNVKILSELNQGTKIIISLPKNKIDNCERDSKHESNSRR